MAPPPPRLNPAKGGRLDPALDRRSSLALRAQHLEGLAGLDKHRWIGALPLAKTVGSAFLLNVPTAGAAPAAAVSGGNICRASLQSGETATSQIASSRGN